MRALATAVGPSRRGADGGYGITSIIDNPWRQVPTARQHQQSIPFADVERHSIIDEERAADHVRNRRGCGKCLDGSLLGISFYIIDANADVLPRLRL